MQEGRQPTINDESMHNKSTKMKLDEHEPDEDN